MLKFFDQVLEGEMKQSLPRWAGIEGINGILENINKQIVNLRTGTLDKLNSQRTDINTQKGIFKSDMFHSGEAFFTSEGSNTYKSDYMSNYVITERNINGKYVLDLVKMFGRKKADEVEEKYIPENSILDLWHQEYKIVSESADQYLEEASTNFKTISDNSTGDVLESLQQGHDTLDELKNTFNDIKVEIEGIFVDSSDTIDEYGKLGFKLIFGVLGLMNIALAVFVLFICLFSGKMCTNCCCCRCLFKLFTHLLWNILYLLMFITFLIGFLFAFIGTIGNDIMSVISFIVSTDNIGQGKENIIVDQLGEAKDYLDICINGNGSIIDLLNIDMNQLDSFDNITTIEDQINQTKKEFEEKRQYVTYSIYKDQLKARLNYSSDQFMLIKDDALVELPIKEDQNFEGQASKYLVYKAELRTLNGLVPTYATETGDDSSDRWEINSDADGNVCGAESATDSKPQPSKPFNPEKCYPIDRNWIFGKGSTSYIYKEAQVISDTLKFLKKANDGTSSDSFISILDQLKVSYDAYLTKYIDALDGFEKILHEITGELRKYINDDDGIFSFINGKFIGLNLKVMLKYLKSALGKDVKTIGICLDIVGCSLALSISSTILLIVIINISIEENKKELKKEEEEKRNNIPEYQQDRSGRVIKYDNNNY